MCKFNIKASVAICKKRNVKHVTAMHKDYTSNYPQSCETPSNKVVNLSIAIDGSCSNSSNKSSHKRT
jgi:hypothetical protein